MTILFPSNFYTLISPENKDELVEVANSADLHENQKFTWGGECNVKKERIKINKIAQSLIPALRSFFEEVGIPFNVKVEEGWRNTYKKEEFQDIHYHPEADLSAVLFLTDTLGEFYFYKAPEKKLETYNFTFIIVILLKVVKCGVTVFILI